MIPKPKIGWFAVTECPCCALFELRFVPAQFAVSQEGLLLDCRRCRSLLSYHMP